MRSRGRLRSLFGNPRPSLFLLDVAPYQAPDHLRWRRVFLSAQPLEQRLLARVDEDCQPGRAIFRAQGVLRELRWNLMCG